MGFVKKAVSGGMNIEKNTFTWTIDNFEEVMRSELSVSQLCQFTFNIGKSLGLSSDWVIYLGEPAAEETDVGKNKQIGCYLKLRKPPAEARELLAKFQIKIKGNNQSNFFFGHTKLANFMSSTIMKGGWGFVVIKHDTNLKNLPLIDGGLVIEFEIEIFAPKPVPPIFTDDVSTIVEEYKSTFLEKLSSDLGKQLAIPSQASGTKTTLVTADNEEIDVNRGILYARSAVFEKMFQTDMKEKKSGVVRIEDISSKTMRVLLHFMYTGTLHNDWRDGDVIAELVYAADKYQLQDLLDFLDQVVGSLCTKETVGKLINLARKLSLKKAENELFEFAKKNISTLDEMIAFSKAADGGIVSHQIN